MYHYRVADNNQHTVAYTDQLFPALIDSLLLGMA